MREFILFCSTRPISSPKKFTFAISSADELLIHVFEKRVVSADMSKMLVFVLKRVLLLQSVAVFFL